MFTAKIQPNFESHPVRHPLWYTLATAFALTPVKVVSEEAC